jgi:hypothetical protein
MKVKPYLIIGAIPLLINIYKTNAQELGIVQQQYIEDIIESLSENTEEEADFSNLFNDLTELLEHPINLNTANEDDLNKLVFLNSFQMASIIDYRSKVGIIRSVYELGYLPGFREKDIQMLERFVVCDEPAQSPIFKKSSFKYSKNRLLVRYQRVPEKQYGYKEVADSILADNPDKTRYLGSPDKLFIRYGFSAGDHINAGIVMEKDAGEEFFKGSNRQGFDFYSAHLFYKNERKLLQSLALGDYHIQLGQGLLMWSSYSGFKTSYVSQLAKRPAVIKRSFSAEENKFLRGVAVTMGKADYSVSLFASHNKIDAAIVTDTNGTSTFTGLTTTGYHNTPLEISKEKQLSIDIFGITARYDANRLKVGINVVYTEYSYRPQKSDKLYKSFAFTDRQIMGLSTDYRYLGWKSNFFGEAAYSNNALAILNGIEFYLKPKLNLGVIHRYYKPAYYSHFSGAFGENSDVANENGLFLVTEARLEKISIKAYGDVFSFPWLKYQVNAPSEGSEVCAEISYTLGNTMLSFRYKRQEKPKNYSDGENQLAAICPYTHEQFRLNATYPFGDYLKMQSRTEFALAGYSDSTKKIGFCLIQDLSTDNLKLPLDITFRVAYFNIYDYNARIYSYEKDVLYAYSSQVFYGKGWRIACLAKWQSAAWVTFYLKYSLSLYPGEETNGSGLNEIDSNHKSEIKAEAIFRF